MMRRGVTAVLVLLAMAILLSLGTWQAQRLVWKENLIAEIEARRTAPPRPLSDIEALARAGESVDYRPVTVTGTYRHEGERHFFTTAPSGQSGYDVLTPLELADGRFVFVNRGFVPFEKKDPATRAEGQLAGPQTVTGLARDPVREKPGALVPENDLAKNIFYWKDFPVLAESAGLSPEAVVPVLVDADATPVPGGYPRGGATILTLPNNHLQYAVTWYGLALALAGVVLVSYLRRRRG